MKPCFLYDLDKIIFAGDWTSFRKLHELLPPNLSISIISTSESKMFQRHKRLSNVKITEEVVRDLRYPAKLFIVSLTNLTLNETFLLMRNSRVWNPHATFFLLNLKSQCSKASDVLQIAWKFNVLNAIFICYEINEKISFYGFNPFTAYAPMPWELQDVLTDPERKHPFTVYSLSLKSLGKLTNRYSRSNYKLLSLFLQQLL